MFTRERKPTTETSYLDRAKKYGTMIVPSLALFLASCSGNEKPSPEVVQKYFKENPEAERVVPETIRQSKESFVNFKDYVTQHPGILDTRDSSVNEIHKELYPGILNNDEWQLQDDSTVIHTYFNPALEKMQKEYEAKGDYMSMGVVLHQTEYVFHSNGEIEVGQGNLLEDKSSNRLVYGRVSGDQGGVTGYHKVDFGNINSMRLTKEGILEKESGYIKGTAQEYMQDNLDEFVEMVHTHIKIKQ